MRQRRRTLKNRGYARANRRKLASQGQDLEVVIKKRRSEMKAIAEEIKEVKLETAKLKLQIEEATKIRQEQPLLFPPLDKIKTDMEADRAGKQERDKLKLQAIIKTKLPHTLDPIAVFASVVVLLLGLTRSLRLVTYIDLHTV